MQNGLGARRGHLEACRLRMERCLADGNDKHRIAINKSQIDTHVAAESENALKNACDGQIDKEPNGDIAGRVDSECAPGSSKDIRVAPTSAPPPRVVLEAAPELMTDRLLKTPPRKTATTISNSGVHDKEPFYESYCSRSRWRSRCRRGCSYRQIRAVPHVDTTGEPHER